MSEIAPHFRAVVREACALVGSQGRLAALTGISQQHISVLCNSAKSISGEKALAIEHATNGRIPRWRLRPDLWPEPKPLVRLRRATAGSEAQP